MRERNCLWCNKVMQIERDSKVVCCDACRMGLARWIKAQNINNAVAFQTLAILAQYKIHPNKSYQYEQLAIGTQHEITRAQFD